MKNKKEYVDTTIEKLARMVAAGFAETATKTELKNMEGRLMSKIDSSESHLALKIDLLGRKLATDLDFDALGKRVARLERA
jgi:hypothetical protein